MHYNGIQNDIVKQLQEVMNKCDNLSQEIKTVKQETINKMNEKFDVERGIYEIRISQLELQNTELKSTITTLVEKNEKLENEVDRLKKQVTNDSDNSSKPPSSDIKKNIPNNRIKTNNKVGGQSGHKPHFLSKESVQDKIKAGIFEHDIIDVGNKNTDKYISKFIVDIKVSVVVHEYRFYQDENGKYNIPKSFKQDVQYGNELKTMCTVLNTEGVVAIDRLSNFIEAITHGALSISNGTVVNFLSYATSKCAGIVKDIEAKLLNSNLMNTDATTARCDNKNIYVRNYSTDKYTLLKATKGKGRKYIEETGILPKYVGDLVHDHETVMYRYGRRHGECNTHVSRYLIGANQEACNKWSLDMRSLLCSLNEYKNKLIQDDIHAISQTKLQTYSNRYDEIIRQGYEQNKNVRSKVYRESEKRLLNRLSKYKENHLLFIYDFDIPFTNNMSERDLRPVKTKQKVSGYFKSMSGIQNYLDIKSVIGTLKKQDRDFYEEILNVFNNVPVSI